jgi:hypothetical protein
LIERGVRTLREDTQGLHRENKHNSDSNHLGT